MALRGWDQQPRLYALVPTEELLRREPAPADVLTGPDLVPNLAAALAATVAVGPVSRWRRRSRRC